MTEFPTATEQCSKYKGVCLWEKEVLIMKYAMCPNCGKRLCKGEPGIKVELECPKCGKLASVIIDADDLRISDKPLQVPTDKPISARA